MSNDRMFVGSSNLTPRISPNNVVFDKSFSGFQRFLDNKLFNNMDGWFTGFTDLEKIEGLENVKFGTDEVSFFSTFENCVSLEKIDLTPLGNIYINGGRQAFAYCNKLTEIDMSNIVDYKANKDLQIGKNLFTGMFNNCTNLEKIYVSDTLEMFDSLEPGFI